MNINKGITLVALVITVIILIILSGIGISILMGENGILSKAKIAKESSDEAEKIENSKLNDYNSIIDEKIGVTTRGESSVRMVTLFESSTGVSSGTLTDSIVNYDLITVIHGTAVGGNTYASITVDPKLAPTVRATFNFTNYVSTTAVIYGTFNFTDNTFTRTIGTDSGPWTNRYIIYKVVGIKYQ